MVEPPESHICRAGPVTVRMKACLPHQLVIQDMWPVQEFANAIQLRKLSMKSWDQDDPHELLGTHAFLPGMPPKGAALIGRLLTNCRPADDRCL